MAYSIQLEISSATKITLIQSIYVAAANVFCSKEFPGKKNMHEHGNHGNSGLFLLVFSFLALPLKFFVKYQILTMLLHYPYYTSTYNLSRGHVCTSPVPGQGITASRLAYISYLRKARDTSREHREFKSCRGCQRGASEIQSLREVLESQRGDT